LQTDAQLTSVAPAGHRVLLQAGPNDQVRVNDVGGAHPVTVDTADLIGDSYHWSPTGDRLVSGYLEKDSGDGGFAIIDVRTGRVTKHPVDHTKYDCSQCAYSFTRDGREVVLALADRSLGEAGDLVAALQFFNATTGAPTRSVPVKVWVPASPFAFSPDGRYLIAEGDRTPGKFQRVDLTTHTAEPFAYEAVWVNSETLLAAEGVLAVALHADGTVLLKQQIAIPDASAPLVFGPPA
jgi:hypothetical protein